MQTRSSLQNRINDRRAGMANQVTDRRRAALDPQRQRAEAVARRDQLGSRLSDHVSRSSPRHMDTNIAARTLRTESFEHRRSYLHASYYDRPDLIMHRPHHLYSYYDVRHHLCHRVIWPSYYFTVGYGFGPYFTYSYVHPYYHRKYLFLSLGGYWPDDYYYMRYYWYGYHPYVWYGYYPVATEVVGETNNYYTYNYYNSDGSVTSYPSTDAQGGYVDHNTFADVREKLAKQQAEPAPQTQADTRFEEGVKSFESGDYTAAADKFARAMQLSPEDTILPFAYAQALFADEQYSKAADVLRQALKNVTPEKEGVFYPRGLYAGDDVLFKQIETLLNKQEEAGNDADLQLLLGYHLLGTGETGYAREPLEQASQDEKNAEAAGILLQLLDKVEKEAGPADKAGAEPQAAPDAQTQSSAATQAEPTAVTPLSSTPGTPAVEGTPNAQTNNVPDASKKDSASQLTTGAGATQVPGQQPASKEDNDEL